MIKEFELPPRGGCIRDQPDERDYIFEETFGAPPPDMPSWDEGYKVEDKFGALRDEAQGQSLACVAFAGVSDIEMSIKIITEQDIQLSPRDAYSQIVLSNGGSSPRDFYKLANQKGICEFDYMPIPITGELTEAQAKYRVDQKPEGITNALKWRIGAYYSIRSLDINAIAQAIFANSGCGGGYLSTGASIGHFVYFNGYGIIDRRKALYFRDSYPPFQKYITFNNDQYFLGMSQPLQLFSVWTAEAGNWPSKNMPTKLVRKRGTNEVFLEIGSERVLIKDEEDFYLLKENQPVQDIEWANVQEVDIFTTPFNGRILGKPDFSDFLKKVFGIFSGR